MAMVFCAACGSKISEGALWCPQCGQPNLLKQPQVAGGQPSSAPGLPSGVAQVDQYRVPPSPAPVQSGALIPPTVLPPGTPGMGFGGAVSSFFRNYAVFAGRARRSEFWFVFLFIVIVSLPINLLTLVFPPLGVVAVLLSLALLVPQLALYSRRLHDIDRSFGWYWFFFVPIVGSIVLLVFTLTDSTPGPNRFGASPKYPLGP